MTPRATGNSRPRRLADRGRRALRRAAGAVSTATQGVADVLSGLARGGYPSPAPLPARVPVPVRRPLEVRAAPAVPFGTR